MSTRTQHLDDMDNLLLLEHATNLYRTKNYKNHTLIFWLGKTICAFFRTSCTALFYFHSSTWTHFYDRVEISFALMQCRIFLLFCMSAHKYHYANGLITCNVCKRRALVVFPNHAISTWLSYFCTFRAIGDMPKEQDVVNCPTSRGWRARVATVRIKKISWF